MKSNCPCLFRIISRPQQSANAKAHSAKGRPKTSADDGGTVPRLTVSSVAQTAAPVGPSLHEAVLLGHADDGGPSDGRDCGNADSEETEGPAASGHGRAQEVTGLTGEWIDSGFDSPEIMRVSEFLRVEGREGNESCGAGKGARCSSVLQVVIDGGN